MIFVFSYMERFTDFLRLFVGIHLRRFESNPNFPVLEFLALLFKYTFRQVFGNFPACWGSAVEYIFFFCFACFNVVPCRKNT